MEIRSEQGRLPAPRIPASTYRLEFNRRFTFRDAAEIVPYLHELGITDIYASPYFRSKPGSLHGYDIVDHNALNPEVGTDKEYGRMVAELRKRGMGQILDIVPNHMCIECPGNAWWIDVLENGPSSPYASSFDIDWDPVKKELKDKVLLPLLGDQYGNVLESQELRLAFEEGAFSIYYIDYKLPLRPHTYILVLEHRIDGLKELLTAEAPELVELLSIVTALRHLPLYTERDPEKVAERRREKEVIKRRLSNLYSSSTAIRKLIDENIRLFNGVKGEPRSFDLLDNLLREQVYRLSHWRVATEEINYRRFFDVNGLGSIRMENPEVFRETHRLVFKLIEDGRVTGLRVDHPDGLYNPSEYFHRLQRNCFIRLRLAAGEGRGPDAEARYAEEYDRISSSDPQYKPFYIVGEKILMKGERMPEEWPIFSTTGYVFMNSANGLFVNMMNGKAFDSIYSAFIKEKPNYLEIMYEKKKLITQVAMSGEVNTLGRYLDDLSEKDRHTRDFTLNSLTRAIVEVVASFPVYRTYINGRGVKDRDRQYVDLAVSKAKRKNPALSESIFDFIKDVLLLRYPKDFGEEDKRAWLDFTMRFQQITGPVMAKGVEDTAFYVYNRLSSLNEVGGTPDRFGTPLETFQGQNIERSKFWPHALIATSTHDSKRSEDVRARINVLSEIPDRWKARLVNWAKLNRKKKTAVEGQLAPHPNDEYLLYQTLVGAWPLEQAEAASGAFRERIREYMLKAAREAKVNTSWISPNKTYEEALMAFIDRVLDPSPTNHFLGDFVPFQKEVSGYGMYNSLSQTLLKIAAPGVPDFYQGTEVWDYSLVDPDNRRPVDYGLRLAMLEKNKRREVERGPRELARELIGEKESGAVKLYLIKKALTFRRENRELFEQGDYVALDASGEKAEHACAFARRRGEAAVIVVAPRFFTRLVSDPGRPPTGREVWGDTIMTIPEETGGARFRDIFTGEITEVRNFGDGSGLALSELCAFFPVACVERIE